MKALLNFRNSLIACCMMIPFLHLARVFGVLPFSSVKAEKLIVSKTSRLISLSVLSVMEIFFLLHFCTKFMRMLSLNEFHDANMRDTIQSATFIINYLLDQFNVCAIIELTWKLPGVVNAVLRGNFLFDKTFLLPDLGWRYKRLYLFLCVTLFALVTKSTLLIILVDYNSWITCLTARYIYSVTLITEQLMSLMCLEMRSRLVCLNKKLKVLRSTINSDLSEIQSIQNAYRALLESQNLLSQCFTKFLLFDLSQMLFQIIGRIIDTFGSYVSMEAQDTNGIHYLLLKNSVYILDCMWRFFAICWYCDALQSEVTIA
jgi:hypothetical protein